MLFSSLRFFIPALYHAERHKSIDIKFKMAIGGESVTGQLPVAFFRYIQLSAKMQAAVIF